MPCSEVSPPALKKKEGWEGDDLVTRGDNTVETASLISLLGNGYIVIVPLVAAIVEIC